MNADGEPHIVGVLLAAGRATRFGSPKQLAMLKDRPLMQHSLDALLAVEEVAELVVVTGAHAERVEAAVASFNRGETVVVARCPDFADGLSASLRCGVASAEARGADLVVVHLADLPQVGQGAVELVIDHALDEVGAPYDVPTRATYAGVDGHPVVLPRACFTELATLTGDTGARDLLKGPRTRRLEVGHLGMNTDIDTPEQLEALRP